MSDLKQKILTMLQLQSEMNLQVHPDWQHQGFKWYRAIWIEAAEMLEHYGWKWWKHQQPDLAQVKLEVIDIFHFMLSHALSIGAPEEHVAEVIAADLQSPRESEDLRTGIELLAMETMKDHCAHFDLLAGLMLHLEMDFDELYQRYVGKNVLNVFRQDHGYKTGEYRKLWNGREDNEYLEDILGELDVDSGSYREEVYGALERGYSALQ